MKHDVREALMSAARATVQASGYSALSFRELAKAVGVKSSSVHYHFPTKGDLGAALAKRYTEEGDTYLTQLLATSQDPTWLLDRYVEVFRAALANDNRMCLCGIMSAEMENLPDEVRQEVDKFTQMNLEWLTKIVMLRHTDIKVPDAEEQALAIFASIEGAQLVARGRQDIRLYDQAIGAFRRGGFF